MSDSLFCYLIRVVRVVLTRLGSG